MLSLSQTNLTGNLIITVIFRVVGKVHGKLSCDVKTAPYFNSNHYYFFAKHCLVAKR